MRDAVGQRGAVAAVVVLTHEYGHHIQSQLGLISEQGEDCCGASTRVRELQADCFAGVWANHAQTQRNALEPGDIEEGLNAAAAVGDDRLQRRSQGYVVPDSFTHGTSAQRTRWFMTGLKSGDLSSCNTFRTEQP